MPKTHLREREILMQVIAALRDMPFLWKKSHKDYTDREMRKAGYNVLHTIYKKMYPFVTMVNLKKKIENMKTGYLNEVKKVRESLKSGSKELYIPTLWYFDAFSFMKLLPSATLQLCSKAKHLKKEGVKIIKEEVSSEPEPPAPCSYNVDIRRRKSVIVTPNEYYSYEKETEMKEEHWEIIGKSIGLQLRDLDQRGLAITQKIISDAIFYAKIGKLTEDSHIVLEAEDSKPEQQFLFFNSVF